MSSAKITKNGMINLPSKIREKIGVEPGDRIAFVERDNKIVLIPIKSVLDLSDSSYYVKTVEMIEELHEERRAED